MGEKMRKTMFGIRPSAQCFILFGFGQEFSFRCIPNCKYSLPCFCIFYYSKNWIVIMYAYTGSVLYPRGFDLLLSPLCPSMPAWTGVWSFAQNRTIPPTLTVCKISVINTLWRKWSWTELAVKLSPWCYSGQLDYRCLFHCTLMTVQLSKWRLKAFACHRLHSKT